MLIVDAYNTLQTAGVLPTHLAGIELEGLAHLIARSRYAARPALLVCDGRPHSQALASAVTDRRFPGRYRLHTSDVLFAGAGKDADTLIEVIISRDSAPARLLVVSTDRRIRKHAAKRGAASITSAEFLLQLAADEARPRSEPYPQFAQEIPLDPYSLAHWMREFGFEPDPRRRTGGLLEAGGPRPPDGPRRSVEPPDRKAAAAREAVPAPTPRPIGPQNADPVMGDPHLTDPLLLEALRHWPGMTPGELDMHRWLRDEPWLRDGQRPPAPGK